MDAAAWGPAIAALAALGLANAVYFLLVTYRWVVEPPWLPRVCRVGGAPGGGAGEGGGAREGDEVRIVDTPEARVLGLPNALLGAAWYALAGGGGLAAWATGATPLCPLLLAGAAGSVALSAWLAWALLRRLRLACLLCLVGHGVNVALLAVLAAACLGL